MNAQGTQSSCQERQTSRGQTLYFLRLSVTNTSQIAHTFNREVSNIQAIVGVTVVIRITCKLTHDLNTGRTSHAATGCCLDILFPWAASCNAVSAKTFRTDGTYKASGVVLHRDLVSGDRVAVKRCDHFLFSCKYRAMGPAGTVYARDLFVIPVTLSLLTKRKAPEIGACAWCLLLLSLAGYVSAGSKRYACAVLVQPGLLQTHPRCLHHHPKSRDRQPRSMSHRWQVHRRGLFGRCCSWAYDSRRSMVCQALRSFSFLLQVSCQGSGWHTICIVASLVFIFSCFAR